MNRWCRKYLLLIAGMAGIHLATYAQQPDTLKPAGLIPVSDSTAISHRPDTGSISLPSSDTTLPAAPGQSLFSYASPRQFTVGGISVRGAKYLDADLLSSISGLAVGDRVTLPGDDMSRAINNLWKQKLFSDIVINISRITADSVFLVINLTEKPKLRKYEFQGAGKGQTDDLKTKTGLVSDRVVTEDTKLSAVEAIRKYYQDKGYQDVQVLITETPDTTGGPQFLNSEDLVFHIIRGKMVKINEIDFEGNNNVSDATLKRQMKDTKELTRLTLHPDNDTDVYNPRPPVTFKQYLKQKGFLSVTRTLHALNPYFRFNLFNSAKFNSAKFQDDKANLIAYYNQLGYRDAILVRDTNYITREGNLNIAIQVNEGQKYYFGDITWKGNTVYPDSVLNILLHIKKGDVYNLDLLQKKLGTAYNGDGNDLSTLYLDNGYLFSQVHPIETSVIGDTINYQILVTEGAKATIKNVPIAGNDKTNEHVVRRELRTIPGNLFSKSEIVRSVREISQLGFFDPEHVEPVPIPNPSDGTVDIKWNVVEKPADQLELSAGWGGYIGLTGTLGLTFNNFSLRNIGHKNAWTPLPSGDGQKLSVRFQSNGKSYSSYNFSFTEPWLGGKKRDPFSVSFFDSKFSNASGYNGITYLFNDSSYLRTLGASVSLGKTLKWPDDYFTLVYEIDYELYHLRNYVFFPGSSLNNGNINDLSLKITLARSSTQQPIYPTYGSSVVFSGQFTPPYSAFINPQTYANETESQKFNFIEYQKYRLDASWYVSIGPPHGSDHKQFVLKAAAKFGMLTKYDNISQLSPFDRFEVGGDGISNYAIYGKEIISQRGYEVYYNSDPKNNGTTPPATYQGFTMFNKFTLELRYPIALNPSSTIFGLVFVEGGNAYNGIQQYNPFLLRRSAGIGMRFYLPMFGLLGFDYGVGLDRLTPGSGLKNATKFSFMLGYEPE
jgi:outer membrane protein insertion porin family